MSEPNLNYLGVPLNISSGTCNLINTLNSYTAKGQEAARNYETKYKSYGSFENFAKRGIPEGYELIDSYIKETAKNLVRLGHYSISREQIISEHGDQIFGAWSEVIDFVAQIYDTSTEYLETTANLRDLRKATRSRGNAIGFGVQGSIGALAFNGAYNAVGGLAHSIANGIGNARSRQQVRDKLKEFYDSKELLNFACSAIEAAFDPLAAAYLEYQGIYTPFGFSIVYEQREKANVMRKNYPLVPDSKKKDAAIEMLTLDPSNIDTYKILLRDFKDSEGALLKLAKMFNLSSQYDTELKAILRSKLSTICYSLSQRERHPGTSKSAKKDLEEAEKQIVSELKQEASEYGLSKESYILKEYIEKAEAEKKRYFDESFTNRLLEIYNAFVQSARSLDDAEYQKNIEELKQKSISELKLAGDSFEIEYTNHEISRYLDKIVSTATEVFNERLNSKIDHVCNKLTQTAEKWDLHEFGSNVEKKAVEDTVEAIIEIYKGFGLPDTPENRQKGKSKADATIDEVKQRKCVAGAELIRQRVINGTSEEIKGAINEIESIMRISPAPAREKIEQINRLLDAKYHEIDTEERTFLGNLFSSQEECISARQQYKQLSENYLAREYTTMRDITAVKDEIENNSDLFPVVKREVLKKLETIQQKLSEQLEKAKTAKQARQKKNGFILVSTLFNLGIIIAFPQLPLLHITITEGYQSKVISATLGALWENIGNSDRVTDGTWFLSLIACINFAMIAWYGIRGTWRNLTKREIASLSFCGSGEIVAAIFLFLILVVAAIIFGCSARPSSALYVLFALSFLVNLLLHKLDS